MYDTLTYVSVQFILHSDKNWRFWTGRQTEERKETYIIISIYKVIRQKDKSLEMEAAY